MQRTVRVGSSVSEKFEPDVIEVSLYLSGTGPTKQASISAYNGELAAVTEGAVSAGVPRDAVRTRYARLAPEWVEDERTGRWRRSGEYEFSATVGFDIPCDEEAYGRVWEMVMGLGFYVSTDFDYDLRDHEAAREKILRRAVSAGRRRAEVLADAVGCDLGDVVNVENGLRQEEDRYYDAIPAGSGSLSDEPEAPVFDPEKVDVSCSVSLEYELVPRR